MSTTVHKSVDKNIGEILPQTGIMEDNSKQSLLALLGVDSIASVPQEFIDNQTIWVFGYGSILWKTGFSYHSKKAGYIQGFVRRFWHGNTTHRGTTNKPGRVATIIPQRNGKVWGEAYELVGENMIREAMKHLYSRECKLGGYIMQQVTFNQSDCICDPVTVLVFRATSESQHYLGPAPECKLASQIIDSQGPSGHNVEYVLLLSMYLRRHMPHAMDEHLSKLEVHLLNMLSDKGTKVEDYVRISYLPDSVLYDNCQKCSVISKQSICDKLQSRERRFSTG